MSLRKQIIYRILSSALCILLLGGALAIWQARKSVDKEVDASSHLALQLIALSLDNNGVFRQSDDLSHFSTLQQTRHLSIQLQKPDGQIIQFTGDNKPSRPAGQRIGIARALYKQADVFRRITEQHLRTCR